MKLIVDVPEELKNKIDNANEDNYKFYLWWFETTLYCAIKNGTSLDNATNGDVIKTMFGDDKVTEFMGYARIMARVGNWFNDGVVAEFDKDWWNAPYQKGSKE